MNFLLKLANFAASIVNLYSTVLVIRIFLSWIPFLGSQNGQRPVYDFLCRITDPFLNLFRSRKLTVGRIDFSTLFAFVSLNIVHSLLAAFATYGTITLGMIIAIVLQQLWSYLLKFFTLLLIILLAIRWIMGRNPSPRSYTWIHTLDMILVAPVNFVFGLFYSGKSVSDEKLVGVSLVFYIVVFIVLRTIFVNLIPFLYSL